MLGIANASVKADCSTPAPMRRDCSISRTSPSTLLKAVKPPTVKTDRIVLPTFTFTFT